MNSAHNFTSPLTILCEAVFEQHVRRVVRQTKELIHARDPSVDFGTPEEHGWELTENGWMPVMFVGQTASELIDGLFCVCALQKDLCSNCPCSLNGISWIYFCSCAGDIKKCHNEKTLFATVPDES